MNKEIEIPEGYEARIESNKVILEPKESEDERIREAIESIIRVYGKTQGEWIAGYDMDTLVVHLRDAFARLERQKEQNPAEWSEEDERMYKAINIALTMPDAKGYLSSWYETPEDAANWLKALRPSWKPSEEQMEALDDAIAMFGYMRMADTLRELYADLKKL